METAQELGEFRINICYKCPLYSTKYGGLCNDKLWLDPITNDVSTYSQPGYTRGCGCLLESKVKQELASCPLDKW